MTTLDPQLLSAPRGPGVPLETGDHRFQTLADQMMAGNYLQAAQGAAPLLAEGHYDIRIISYFLLGLFLERGPGGLLACTTLLQQWLGEHWALVGPQRKKTRHAAASLVWLFDGIHRRLSRMTPESPAYTAWVHPDTAEIQEEILTRTAALLEQVEERLDSEQPALMLRTLQAEVRRIQPRTTPAAAPEPPAAEAPAAAPTPALPTRPDPVARSAEGGVMVEGSHEMATLLRKLAAFELLLAADEYQKAALVADDLQELIGAFDPRRYFPRLFTGFYRGLSENIAPLASAWQDRETLHWQILQELYRVDLESFVAE